MFQTVLVAAEWLNIQPLMQFVRDVKDKWEHNRKVNETINELSALTDKELNDIGINRGMIRSVAEEAYNPNLKGWV